MKKRSMILIDLINDEIDVKKAFQLLSLLLEDLNNKEIENWLNYELNGYPKEIKARLTALAENIYPLLPNNNNSSKKGNKNTNNYSNTFSSGMNNTLNNMRSRY